MPRQGMLPRTIGEVDTSSVIAAPLHLHAGGRFLSTADAHSSSWDLSEWRRREVAAIARVGPFN